METKSGKVLMTVFCRVLTFFVQTVLTPSLKKLSVMCMYSWNMRHKNCHQSVVPIKAGLKTV